MLSVIVLMLPTVVPRLMGYEVYNVVSGSMEPSIPMGSMIVVDHTDAAEVASGDVIAFRSGNSVVTHRVTQNRRLERRFVTKGDANHGEDLNTVSYESLVGVVIWHMPTLGGIVARMSTVLGKLYLFSLLISGLLLNLISGRLRAL